MFDRHYERSHGVRKRTEIIINTTRGFFCDCPWKWNLVYAHMKVRLFCFLFLFLFFLLYHHINSWITTILELWITFDNWICICISIAIVRCCVNCDLWHTVSCHFMPTSCSIIEKLVRNHAQAWEWWIVIVLLMLTWVIKHIGYSLIKTFGDIKIIFLYNFHDICCTNFLITLFLCIWFWKSLLGIIDTISILNYCLWNSIKYNTK